MFRRSFLKAAAVCVILPALRWVPVTAIEEEPETITVYMDTWMNVHFASRRQIGIITPP